MKRIQQLLTISKRGQIGAALFAVVLSLTGFAHAESMTHTAKKGKLTITAPTEVGGAILQPGDYEVREIHSASGPVVEFVRHFRNELASELVQADEEEVAAQVKFTEQTLNAPPKLTQLVRASNSTNTAVLEIRGVAVGYVFTQSPMSASSDGAAAAPATGGQHE
jgi:hypothetical protein